MIRTVHVFCRVVDNFGDAGVCWRLARQLAREHGLQTSLFVDQPRVLARLVPELGDTIDAIIDDVHVRAFDAPCESLPDLVVEAFGCGLPAPYLEAMAHAKHPPCWVNLEYLSAESWVEGVHGLPSPQPRLPLTRHFFMPGFAARTGGLLRERDLIERRNAWRDAHSAAAWWRRYASPPPSNALTVSLFCYANRALPALFEAWANDATAVFCVVPDGVAADAVQRYLGSPSPRPGEQIARGSLTLAGFPFLPQSEYDHLLWSCALNVVRGEDSFVRAQWAARPLVWHIYPQDDAAHLAKLDAFLQRYLEHARNAESVRRFWHAFNHQDGQ
ncbi:MAG TPA: elongation factor P maturation arginine rhamnosyltransferase EarP, partial [Casimicrobiaceae bacterium]|nr:elongation factor P maturation arginine rhamnosyltransferase EarP [Casimicrobiaceae bacterium]